MPLQPVTRRSVPDEVFDQVLSEVVDGGLEAGEALPSERRLAEVLGVSRPAVREALQRMAQTRLLDVRHGGATTVRDFRRYAGLDLLPRLLVRRGELDPAVARSSSVTAPPVALPVAVKPATEQSCPSYRRPLPEISPFGDTVSESEETPQPGWVSRPIRRLPAMPTLR